MKLRYSFCRSVVIGGILLVGAVLSLQAQWTIETNAHPSQPGQVLDISYRASPVAQFVFGGAAPAKPYLHVFGTDGEVLTQGEPTARYPHHRGVFIGWDEVDSDLGSHDLWHMDTGTMTVAEVERVAVTSDAVTFRVRNEWRAGTSGSGALLLTEWRTIRVAKIATATLVDHFLRLRAERALTLNGDLQHAGFHFRAHNEVNLRSAETSYLESPAGQVAGHDLRWCRLQFPRGRREYAATLYNAPHNPVEELSQRDYGRFGYFFSRPLLAGEILSLGYRLHVEDVTGATGAGTNVIYEAEDARLGGGAFGGPAVNQAHPGYTGTGYVDYNANASTGEYIEWTVITAAAGCHGVKLRYAFGSADRPLELRVNGQVVNAALDFPNTGGWANWSNLNLALDLLPGANRIRLTAIGFSGANFDHLVLQLPVGTGCQNQIRSTQDQAYDQYALWLQTDPDADGHTTIAESVTGTDPLDPASAFRITGMEFNAPNNPALIFPDLPGRCFQIRRSTNLVHWEVVTSPVFESVPPHQLRWLDPSPSANACRFYQVTVSDPP